MSDNDCNAAVEEKQGGLSEAHKHWIAEGVRGHRASDAAIERMRLRRLETNAKKPLSATRAEKLRIQALKESGEWIHGNVGRQVSEEQRERQRQAMTGKKHSDATKAKIAAAKKGKTASKEARRKMAEAQRARHARARAERDKIKES